jgi:hypothetical protein
MNGKSMMKPALLGGLVIGVLSELPVVSLGNCCCCAWIILGGMLAAHLLQSNSSEPITLGDGAVAGLLAGLFGAVVQFALSIPLRFATGPIQQRIMQRVLDSSADLPEESRRLLEQLSSGTAMTIVGLIASFMMMLVLGSVFSSLGGFLGVFFFRKKHASQPPAEATQL